jgi:hypothetical protein
MKDVRDAVRQEMDDHQTRRRSTDAYIQKLHEADAKITEFIQQAIKETTRAYRLSVNLYFISQGVAFLILLVGLALFVIKPDMPNLLTVAMILIAVSLIWAISMQRNNPVKNSRHMVNHLAKLNIIFAGYIREMHLTDAYFERLYSSGTEIDLKKAEHMLNNLQDLVSEGTSNVTQVTNDADE